MLIKKAADIPSSEITPKSLYLTRRKFLAGAAIASAAAPRALACARLFRLRPPRSLGTKSTAFKKSPFTTTETITPYKDVTTYNNYYEFSTDKDGPANSPKISRPGPGR